MALLVGDAEILRRGLTGTCMGRVSREHKLERLVRFDNAIVGEASMKKKCLAQEASLSNEVDRSPYDQFEERFINGLPSAAAGLTMPRHEARHFSDKEEFPNLADGDLEYRAKLTELAFSGLGDWPFGLKTLENEQVPQGTD